MLSWLHQERGDTIIEVLIAITVFSMVAFGTLTIMNQGTNAAQRALEISQVRMQIDSQAEALRAAQQAAPKSSAARANWQAIAAAEKVTTSSYSVDEQNKCPETSGDVENSFIMDTRNADYVDEGSWYAETANANLAPFAQMDYSDGSVKSHGIWIERTHTEGGDFPDRYDFVIRACWEGAGVSVPMQLQTVVRLYEPL